MQDVQNIPNPDTDNDEKEFGSHAAYDPKPRNSGVESPGKEGDPGEAIPLPADRDPFPSLEDPEANDDDERGLL